MKIKSILTIAIVAVVFGIYSCASDEPAPQVLKISENVLRFSANGGVWKLTVNSNCDWQIRCEESWCRPDTMAGSNTADLLIRVDTNDTRAERSASLTFSSERQTIDVNIYQDTTSGSNYFYELPVIFHLFYAEPTDSLQNAAQAVFDRLIAKCNELYSTATNSVNMNLRLVAATEDPDGNPLAEPGIERILKSPAALMSSSTFMAASTKNYTEYAWDYNRYINVFVYTFTEEDVAGVSHLPYTSRENTLEGLEASNYYFSNTPTYTHCISINNKHILNEDAYTTLAHELGHYLGLMHTFSEKGCDETDYCDDTPNYDRSAYMEWLEGLTPPLNFLEVVQRTDCEGNKFISTNVMDYYYSYMNRFTAAQYRRVRHVLENSPLIPGPKNIITTKAAADDVVPPVRAIE